MHVLFCLLLCFLFFFFFFYESIASWKFMQSSPIVIQSYNIYNGISSFYFLPSIFWCRNCSTVLLIIIINHGWIVNIVDGIFLTFLTTLFFGSWYFFFICHRSHVLLTYLNTSLGNSQNFDFFRENFFWFLFHGNIIVFLIWTSKMLYWNKLFLRVSVKFISGQ